MELETAERAMRGIDALSGDLLICAIFADERPPMGLAGLVDWRAKGALSRLCLDGTLTGARDETLLFKGDRGVRFERIVVVGLGDRGHATRDDALAAIDRAVTTIRDLHARRVAIELPGRHADLVPAAEAAERLATHFAALDAVPSLETLTLVDAPSARGVYAELTRRRAIQRRRTET